MTSRHNLYWCATMHYHFYIGLFWNDRKFFDTISANVQGDSKTSMTMRFRTVNNFFFLSENIYTISGLTAVAIHINDDQLAV